ncbi:PfkB family carbohydrate kinase [Xanthomonas arboricola]|uniref:PfkB family carbohydrate kinase n=1 Tax=Xanthomonas arboricola TaxID=56448 RepID=UPI0015E3A774|nr:PfkB family carbohydrate kinase [Xanthomonas arboricola]
MPRLVGTGLLALDLIVQHDDAGQRLTASGGGTCGNVLAILARLGWDSSWLGAMGPSAPGRILIEEMQRGGVQMHTSPDDAQAPIFAHHINICADGHASHWFSDACPVCARRLPRYSRPSDSWLRDQAHLVQSADVFFVDRLSAGALDLARVAHRCGALVVYEPSSTSDTPWMADMIAIADVVKFSSDRASVLRGCTPANERTLWVETRGRDGLQWSLSRVGADREVTPAEHNSHAIDACGAGDWFTSALLFGLAHTQKRPDELTFAQLTALMRQASGVAAWSCGFLGARGGLYDAPVHAIFEHLQANPERAGESASLLRPVPRVDAAAPCVYAAAHCAYA